MRITPCWLCLLLLAFAFPGRTLAWPATVLWVGDGDSLSLARVGTPQRSVAVRLYGVDAPELDQAGGQEARAWLAARLPKGSRVDVSPRTRDSYGRVVAVVTRDGEVLNQVLVAAGHAWVYQAYCTAPFCRDWRKAEQRAKARRLGLWRDPNPLRPTLWRKRHPRQPARR